MARRKEPGKAGDPELGDISARLRDLGSRLDAEKNQQKAQAKPAGGLGKAEDYSVGYKVVSEFAAGILVGAALGYGLDKLFGTTPLLLIVFLIFGFAASILNLWRSDQKSRMSPEDLAKLPKVADDDEDK